MQVGIEMPNVEKILKAWRKAPESVRKHLGKAVQDSTMLAEAESVKEAPIDSGTLRSSITSKITDLQGVIRPNAGRKKNLKYAFYVHDGTEYKDGTTKMKARPFFETAKENIKDKVFDIFEKALEKTINEL